MTGAKLLGMHETVTSPKSTDLGVRLWPCGDAGVVERSYAGDVGAFAGPGGNLRRRPQLRVGIVWGGPGRCWRETARGSRCHPTESPRPPSTGCLRIGWLQAGIPRFHASRSACTIPAAEEVCGTAPVTYASVVSQGRGASPCLRRSCFARRSQKRRRPSGRRPFLMCVTLGRSRRSFCDAGVRFRPSRTQRASVPTTLAQVPKGIR